MVHNIGTVQRIVIKLVFTVSISLSLEHKWQYENTKTAN